MREGKYVTRMGFFDNGEYVAYTVEKSTNSPLGEVMSAIGRIDNDPGSPFIQIGNSAVGEWLLADDWVIVEPEL